ncbi:MAG TPA: DUF3231 family protein [Methylomusa anaerophila]|uniref:Coat F domain protein n=1 Tax=Methylomusa anaerophila TaxID=1930071 RepID=A0A348AK84_9FIRM|nr:DUF3231 family protein [Methylomusa anaerophila]BBB91482.1 hypothetical protein MAMMFC1_02166 [Methylomusa anaerophila]HML89929.1 DUF3231 family protein [Methylomusa anaerophila]
MHQELKTHLSAAEVGALWTQYTDATMTACMLKYFLAKNEDKDIGQVVEYLQQVTQTKIQRIRKILQSDNYPVPIGFGDNDVNSEAPRLYSDSFALAFIRNITRLSLTTYGLALSTCARQDVRQHYHQCLADVAQVDEKAVNAEQAKGLYMRAPCISAPEKPEFIQDSDYLGTLFGSKRPLSAIEIANIFVGIEKGIFSKALLMGFAQVAAAKELREFFLRGKQIAHKHADILGDLLTRNDMPAPASPDSYVTNSIVAPFSDRLMLQYTILSTQASFAYYGTALALVTRSDIFGSYVRLMTEGSQYLEDANMLMIRHKWLEQPPLAEDRRALVRR